MKQFFSVVLFFLALTLSAIPNETELNRVRIYGKTDKSALSYKPGETMVFTFKADFDGLPSDGLYLRFHRRGDDGKHFHGRVPANQTLTVKTSLDKPGFVNVDVALSTENNKAVFMKRRSGHRLPVGFFAGAAVEPEKLTDCGEPEDFDEFWQKQKARLNAVPFAGKTSVKLINTINNVNIYQISIPCVGRPATGYLSVPAGAKNNSLPIYMDFSGYGARRQYPPTRVNNDRICLFFNAHGQELGREDSYYDRFFRSINTNGVSYGFDPELNKDPETTFFNGMVLRLLRALQYLKTRPEWDGKNIRLASMSQGALHTIWAAALDPDVTWIDPSIAWFCDLAGSEKAGRIHGSWRVKYSPALDYYDPVFMAKRIKNAQVEITRASLGDYTSPPSGLAIFFNNLATPHKSIRWIQGSDHTFVPEFSEIITWKNFNSK